MQLTRPILHIHRYIHTVGLPDIEQGVRRGVEIIGSGIHPREGEGNGLFEQFTVHTSIYTEYGKQIVWYVAAR